MPHIDGEDPITVKLFDGSARFDKVSGDLIDAEVKERITALVKKLEAAATEYKVSSAGGAAAV
jgi:hypothetical protein